ncbi:MAG: hypothetical protein QHJ82_07250, partial [Verrucomicrobiota bacterium]|nr:hypothetical protein [Verrucomicrobiota bacterium]
MTASDPHLRPLIIAVRRTVLRNMPSPGIALDWTHSYRSRKSCGRSFTGWVRRRIAALPQRVGKSNRVRSAAVLGRINPTTDLAPVSITQIRWPIVHLLGAAKNRR